MSLSIVIPTLGRPSLDQCVSSVYVQTKSGDELIIVGDPAGNEHEIARVANKFNAMSRAMGYQLMIRLAWMGGDPCWGQQQRNHGNDLAMNSHVWCLADDNIAAPHGIGWLRNASNDLGKCKPHAWAIFRAGRGAAEPWLWSERKIKIGNVDADMILAPSRCKSRWGMRYIGDYDFARELRDEFGEPKWYTPLVAVTNPNVEYLEENGYDARLFAQA